MSIKPLETIDPQALATVAGGASRTASGSDAQLTAMLTQITSSIKDLASSQSSGMDPMMMMMMMMMMGGGGGGAIAGAGVSTAHSPIPTVNVDATGIGGGGGGGGCGGGGGGGKGKKGW